MSKIKELTDKRLAHPPKWMPNNVVYETIMGSVSYGVSSDTSDMDIYSFCLPMREDLFPHLRGDIVGFDNPRRFSNYQEHHVFDQDAMAGKGRSYDLNCYNIVDYFKLIMQMNPNMVDSIFTPSNCVLHITRVGTMVRENRKMFLHKGAWAKFKGYSYSSLHKAKNKKNRTKMKDVIRFENDKGLSNKIRLPEIEAELNKRNLWQKIKGDTQLWDEYQSILRKPGEARFAK